jgi:hypothetical protein
MKEEIEKLKYRLYISKKYIDIFIGDEDLISMDIKIDNKMIRLTRDILNDNYKIFEKKSHLYPESWYQDVNENSIDIIMDKFNHPDNSEKYLCIKTKTKEFFFFHMLDKAILEINENMSIGRPDLKERLEHIEKYWSGILGYEFIKENDEGNIAEYVERYYIFKTDWINIDGSTGGGHITSIMSRDELKNKLRPDETYHEVGPYTFRLKKEFLKERNV